MEQFLMDMILNKPLAKALMSRVEQIVLNLEEALLGEIGPYVQMAETQDDLGTQHAPMISPAMYREFIQPSHARLAALIKKKTGGDAKVFMHSDGSIFDMLPDVIDAGIEVINPVQPQAAKMDAVAAQGKIRESPRFPRWFGPAAYDPPWDGCGRGKRSQKGSACPGERWRVHLFALS